jgi:hypothetical protein
MWRSVFPTLAGALAGGIIRANRRHYWENSGGLTERHQKACCLRRAYPSQFLDPIGWAWRIKAKIKAQLIGDEDPDERDLPPKPNGMRWTTYGQWVRKYDAAEEALDTLCGLALARLLKRV